MSRYEELAALAVRHHNEETEYTDACERAIEVVGRALAKYLGAPHECVMYQRVRRGLELGDVVNPTASGFVGGFSTPNRDGHRYVAIRTTFGPRGEDPLYVATSIIGVRREVSGFVLRVLTRADSHQDFTINPTDGSGVEAFCEWMCVAHRRFFTTSITEHPQEPITEQSRDFGYSQWVPRS
jgi:hypothetical protein